MSSFNGSITASRLTVRAGGSFDGGGNRLRNVGAATEAGDAVALARLEADVPPATKYERATGVVAGGFVTVNGGDATKFDIASGEGFVSDPTTGVTSEVTWAASAGNGGSYSGRLIVSVFIDAAGQPVLIPGSPAVADAHSNILLGVLRVVPGGDTIGAVDNEPRPAAGVGCQLYETARALGFFNVSGNAVAATSGADLSFWKAGGTVFAPGAGFHSDRRRVHTLDLAALGGTSTAASFAYRFNDGSSLAAAAALDPGLLDAGAGSGSPGSVASARWSNQRVHVTTANELLVAPAQTSYTSKANAISSLVDETATYDEYLENNTVLVGFITIKADATNSNEAVFTGMGRFGTRPAAGQAGDLQGAYDGSAEILTAAADGAVVLRRGTASESDAVLEVRANDATPILSVHGDRVVFAPGAVPGTADSAGTPGQIAWDTDYLYICVDADSWKRTILSTGW